MATDVGPATVIYPRLDVRVRKVNGKFMVALGSEAFVLNESTEFIWRRLDGRRTVGDIADLLAAEYDIDVETALADTTDVLADLASRELVGTGSTTRPAHGARQ